MAGVPPAGRYASLPGHYAPSTPAQFQPFGGLAAAASAFLGAMAVVALVGLGAHLNRVGLLEREFGEGRVTLEELEDADAGVAAASGMYVLGLLGTAAVFITWQHRHAVNADALAGSRVVLGPGWAIGGWFVPCANWLRDTTATALVAPLRPTTRGRARTCRPGRGGGGRRAP
jgi:hypothetical protein